MRIGVVKWRTWDSGESTIHGQELEEVLSQELEEELSMEETNTPIYLNVVVRERDGMSPVDSFYG